MILKGWIPENNLTPFCVFLARRAGYDLSDGEMWSIECGIKESDYEANKWFRSEFVGESKIEFRFAQDPGTSVVFFQITCDDQTAPRIEAAIEIMGDYSLVGGMGPSAKAERRRHF